LFVLDQMQESSLRSGLSQFIPLMVGLNLLNEIGGTSYSVARLQDWCEGASPVKPVRLRFPGVTLVEVTK
jgi:hypothetical protein